MHNRRPLFFLFTGLLFLIVGVVVLLTPPQPVAAQCGSQASSCQDCHETQAKDPVNKDGTKWHESHAFGDFCVICHSGNSQATEQDAAHMGMVAPLSDAKTACQQCHAADLEARVKVYADILNITSGGQAADATKEVAAATSTVQAPVPTIAPTSGALAAPTTSSDVAMNNAPSNTGMVVDDPNVIDYVQRYNEIVLGQRAVNPSDNILIGLILFVLVLGAGLVVYNETRIHQAAVATKAIEGHYPAEVVDMLPAITQLTPRSRHSLRNILQQPKKTDKVLDIIDKLVSDEKNGE